MRYAKGKSVCQGNFKKILALCLLLALLRNGSMGQGRLVDYQRAEALNAAMPGSVRFSPESVYWLADGHSCWYQQMGEKGREFLLVDLQTGKKRPAFDPIKLAKALEEVLGEDIDPYKLPFTEIRFTGNNRELGFTIGTKRYSCNLSSYECRLEQNGPVNPRQGYWGDRPDESQGRPVRSPDGRWEAYIKESNVYIRRTDSSTEIQLSADGAPGDYYAAALQWSPDSRKLATVKIRPGNSRTLYLIESSPADQLQPKLQTRNYLKPGDALPQRIPVIFLVEQRKVLMPGAAALANQYALHSIRWRQNSSAISFEYNQRGHQLYKVMELDSNGVLSDRVVETSSSFIDYSSKHYRYDLDDGREIIWASERDGWNHLYLFGADGKLKNQITRGQWVLRRVLQVDQQARTILFEASGREPGQDPYFIHCYRIGFDGSGLVRLTEGDGNHRVFFSPDYKWFADLYSRVDEPQRSVIRDGQTGKLLWELERGDISQLLKTGWRLPEVFTAAGRDGITPIWGIIIRPSNFDPRKKYPVIEYIYAGPHSNFVPKNFVTDSRGSLHELAELGFIVVQCDGMGTNNRSRAFHDYCWKNLKDAGFPDRIAWLRAAAERYPYMDLNRVGIFGNSAGGQSAAGALLQYPDFYKVAVSSSGCHDNRMDKIWWNEQWMGYPIGPQYAASANLTYADSLRGKLLLILGELDDNVDPSSTYQFMNALIKANKNFDFLLVPGMGHSLGGDYGEHKRRDFFVKHLLHRDPPEWTWKPLIGVPKP